MPAARRIASASTASVSTTIAANVAMIETTAKALTRSGAIPTRRFVAKAIPGATCGDARFAHKAVLERTLGDVDALVAPAGRSHRRTLNGTPARGRH
jgi:hypothetical protein